MRTRLKKFSKGIKQSYLNVRTAVGDFANFYRTVFRLADAFATVGDDIAKTAQRLQMTTGDVQSLRFAIERQGGSSKTLTTAIRTMSRQYYNLSRGSAEAKDAFNDLGLTYDDLEKLSPADQFRLISSRLSEVEDQTKKAALAQVIFGRSGTELMPLLGNVENLEKTFKEKNLEIRKEYLKTAEDFKDASGDVGKAWNKFGVTVIGNMPILIRALNELVGLLVSAAEHFEALQRGIIKFRFGYEIQRAINVPSQSEIEAFERSGEKKLADQIAENKQIPLLEKQIEEQRKTVQGLKDNKKNLAALPTAIGKGTSAQLSFISNLKRQTVQDKILAEQKKEVEVAEKQLEVLEKQLEAEKEKQQQLVEANFME